MSEPATEKPAQPVPPAPSAPQAASPPAGTPIRHVGLRVAAIGFGAGLLNGLLGIGGGILIVPGLILLLGVTPRKAVSTSLGAVLFMALVALGVHVSLAGFYFTVLGTGLLLVAGVVGSQIGSVLLSRISQRAILYAFAAFTVFASTNLILQGLGLVSAPGGPPVAPPLWGYLAIGLMAGFLSGMLGVGGGGIVVLGFATFFHTPILGGIPLALAVNVVNSGSGVLAQWRTGQVMWNQVARLVPAALVGVGVGVVLALVMPGNLLKVLFALFFIYMGIGLVRRVGKS